MIIPTWNEEGYLADAILSARQCQPGEILVVDGGSDDATVRIAATLADRVFLAPRGRARQMNFGAARARGEFLCFLHADCRLAPGALFEAAKLLQRPHLVAGCFRQRHEDAHWQFRCLDAAAQARVRLLGLAYGDQGIFVRRDIFLQSGGFPEVPLFEDALLSRRLRRFGKLALARSTVFVSPRRWQQNGFWRQTFLNWLFATAFLFGAPLPPLARVYNQRRSLIDLRKTTMS